jgi:hypothetical protein
VAPLLLLLQPLPHLAKPPPLQQQQQPKWVLLQWTSLLLPLSGP